MNILMLNYEFPPIGGGAGRAHENILRQYAQTEDLRVDVLTSGLERGFSCQRFAANINIYKVGIHKKDLHYWRKTEVIEWLIKANRHYRRLIEENNYDLAHAFFAFPSGWLCYRTVDRLPYIVSLRGSDVPGYNLRLGLDYKLLAGLFRKIWSQSSAVIANSNGLRDLAHQFMPNLHIDVICNGINTKNFSPPPYRKISSPVKLLTVSRLIGRKRIDILIKAVAEVQKSGLDVRLNIVGHGNLMNNLQKLSMNLGVADNVNFLGRIPAEQMPQVYRSNDVFLMSSAHEGMSNAMLEAMASGMPIVTTRCEGVEELLTHPDMVVEKPDAQLIAGRIIQLVQEPEKYTILSNAVREQAELFSWRHTAQLYCKYYNTIIDENNRG